MCDVVRRRGGTEVVGYGCQGPQYPQTPHPALPDEHARPFNTLNALSPQGRSPLSMGWHKQSLMLITHDPHSHQPPLTGDGGTIIPSCSSPTTRIATCPHLRVMVPQSYPHAHHPRPA